MKLTLSILIFVFALQAHAVVENSFVACGQRLVLASNHEVKIHVQGEKHSLREPLAGLIASAERDEIRLIVEGAPYGKTAASSHPRPGGAISINLNASGPIFGGEDALSCAAQNLQVHYLTGVNVIQRNLPGDMIFADKGFSHQWLAFLEFAFSNDALWDRVMSDPKAQEISIVTKINRLKIDTGAIIGKALPLVPVRRAYPNSGAEYGQVLRLVMLKACDLLLEANPGLSAWLEDFRLFANGNMDIDVVIRAKNNIQMIRDLFFTNNTARIIANHFQEKKPFVVSAGTDHVWNFERILRREFAGMFNIEITSNEGPGASDLSSPLDSLLVRMRQDFRTREQPSLPRPLGQEK